MAGKEARSSNSDRAIITISLLVTLAAVAVAAWIFAPAVSLPNVSSHIYWYLGRSAGLIAFWLLFLSVVLGIAVSSRVFDGLFARGWVYDIHKFLSIFVLLAMVFHVAILLPDPWAKFTLIEFLVPFKSHYRPTGVALGTITLYASIAVTASFYLKRFIGQKGWRWLHYTTFGLFVIALVHGLLAGTDSTKPAAQISYFVAGIVVLFLVFFRILVTRAAGGKPRTATPARRPQAAQSEMKAAGNG